MATILPFASSQVALVADIDVSVKTGKILVKHVWIAQNNGVTVNLEGVTTQMSGALIQGLSRALYEEATWNKDRVTSLDWVSYPILRFKDSPPITFSVVQRKDIPAVDSGTVAANGVLATGSGEPPTAPIAAAVANAFFDATGIRIRQAPFTAARVRAVLKAASG